MGNFLKICLSGLLFLCLENYLFSASRSASSGYHSEGKIDHKEDSYYRSMGLISKGWNLLFNWDFYNNPEDWNISSATRKATGGYIRIEDGILEFGFSTLGAIIYKENKAAIIPGYNYLMIARVKVNNPYRGLLGFYKPPDKKLHHYCYIKNVEWAIVACPYSFVPYAGKTPIENLYLAFQVFTQQDNIYIDWVELWAYPEKSS